MGAAVRRWAAPMQQIFFNKPVVERIGVAFVALLTALNLHWVPKGQENSRHAALVV
jgi:hypothetical protein